ncbi:MAG: GNAT family N-acetyltransferase [Thermoguttaceae bacterium]
MAGRFEIEELTPAQDPQVVEFLDRLAQGSPSVLAYHYPCFREMQARLGAGRPWYLALRRGEQLAGLLPVFVSEADVGLVYCSLPLWGPTAGVLCPEGPDSGEIHARLLGHLLARARQAKALSCSVYTPFLCPDYSPYDRLQPEAVVDKFTHYTPLDRTRWNGKIRYDLRAAQHSGVHVCGEPTPEAVEAFYQIHREQCAQLGILPKPRQCVEELVQPGVLGRHSHFCLATYRGEIVAGLLTLYSPATASYYIPCTRRDARRFQPGTLLLDRAIRDLRALGVRFWDWEGSPGRDSGVCRFKQKWNAVEASRRIYVWCPLGVEPLRKLGRHRLAAAFPGVFVYPFDRL